MSLVAYGSSDSDEEECDKEPLVTNVHDKSIVNESELIQQNMTSNSFTHNLFTTLPQPKNIIHKDLEEEADEFLLIREKTSVPDKLKRQPIKISVPAMSEFTSEEDTEEKKIKPQVVKTAGLFNILPPPKGSVTTIKSFVPNVLMNKSTKPAMVKPNLSKRPVKKSTTPIAEDSDDDDDDDEQIEIFDVESWQKVCGRQQKKQKVELQNTAEHAPITVEAAPSVAEPEKPYRGLDNTAFKELVGKSKLKRENIEVIDIHEEEIMPDPDIWKTKALTDPAQEAKPKTEDPVNDMSRKKHHITYLAQRAKAMEQELKNQWANNRMSKQQTQAKYGF